MSNNLITMKRLGKKGRWGNQVFEYAFLRTYAHRHGLQYQTDSWIGQFLLGFDDPRITENLPTYHERRQESAGSFELGLSFPPGGDEAGGHDIDGYCQFHTSYYAADQEFLQRLFVPTCWVRGRMDPVLAQLRQRGKTIIGFHMRRGDTGRLIYYLTPNDWYLQWLEEHWNTYDDPVLIIASEVPEDRKAFARYNPVMSSDLLDLSNEPYAVYNYLRSDLSDPTPISMDWFPDWWLLSQCDVLAFGNSTFSFTAAMMNRNLRECYRSRLSTQAFERIDPWDSWPLVYEDLRDYPGVADTWYDRNLKWKGGTVNDRS